MGVSPSLSVADATHVRTLLVVTPVDGRISIDVKVGAVFSTEILAESVADAPPESVAVTEQVTDRSAKWWSVKA